MQVKSTLKVILENPFSYIKKVWRSTDAFATLNFVELFVDVFIKFVECRQRTSCVIVKESAVEPSLGNVIA